MADDPFGRPLTLKEVAHALHVSTKTVQRWIKEKRFPPAGYSATGGECWFAKDLDAYLHYAMRGTWRPEEETEEAGGA